MFPLEFQLQEVKLEPRWIVQTRNRAPEQDILRTGIIGNGNLGGTDGFWPHGTIKALKSKLKYLLYCLVGIYTEEDNRYLLQ